MKAYPEQHIRLADGRHLSYDNVGAPDGTPVLYFHGVPSARVEWQMWGDETMLQQLGVRLIAIDRPSVGSSTFQQYRRLSDWPADVAALADRLGLQQFGVLGYSGGGPYAAVCARQIPERLIHTALVSSLAPFDLPGMLEGVAPGNVQFLKLAVQKPWLFRLLYGQIGLLTRLAPGQFLKRALGTFEAADRAAFARPEVHGPILAAHGSGRSQQMDTALIISAWDFDLGEIAVPVQLWRGEQDHNASAAMFDYLARTIPKTQPHRVPGEGHISLIVNHVPDILKTFTRKLERKTKPCC
ncbi:MAG TPA: alpha/beta hydrolase [Anaerolineales bacterium]|nr:alpha/beta hydrolase [Anaerolineales bacterium]